MSASTSRENADPNNVGTGRALYVPEELLVATWRGLSASARLGCEGTVRWAGPAFQSRASLQVATTVVIPGQRIAPGAFEVPHDATRAMGEALATSGLVNIAQLHSHPGTWVGHSDWDDAHAYSSRDGALSIVWPQYARALPAFAQWGIHERVDGAWLRLGSTDAARRILIVSSVLDLRVTIESLTVGLGSRDDRNDEEVAEGSAEVEQDADHV